jgi:predicted transcriptional regulator
MKLPKFLLRGFSRPREAILSSLGKLEREAMDEVWHRGDVNVRQVVAAFDDTVAYTTVMTTLDRLFKKRLLVRRKEGKAFVYSARYTLDELERGMAEDVIDTLLGHDAAYIEPVLACIVDTVSQRDRELLDELERLVKQKRLELDA